jgi:hypothetical protein
MPLPPRPRQPAPRALTKDEERDRIIDAGEALCAKYPDAAYAILWISRRVSVRCPQIESASLVTEKRDLIISLANKNRLPAIFVFRYYAEAGGLVSYGVDNHDLYRRAASYVDRILKGEKPSDLPVQEATKFQLVINLKTAKALGLEIPSSVLARAGEVIE